MNYLKAKMIYVKLVIGLALFILIPARQAFSLEKKQQDLFVQKISDARDQNQIYACLEEAKQLYFSQHQYADFVDFLKKLPRRKKGLQPFISYYTADSRYQELKYLEANQDWEQYFSNVDALQRELEKNSAQAISATKPKDLVNFLSHRLLYMFHKDQEDGASAQALDNLIRVSESYAVVSNNPALLLQTAELLHAYNEKAGSKRLYELYAQQIEKSNVTDEELEKIAADFYDKGNLQLGQTLYEIYIERLKNSPTEKATVKLAEIAKRFAFQDGQAKTNPLFAETIFQEIEKIAGKDYFDQELMYLRAFNLEKIRSYKQARDIYLMLLERFPSTIHADEASFKIGVISAYALKDIQAATATFIQLSMKEQINSWVISCLYQLGLLSQWMHVPEQASGYYEKLITLAKDDFQDTVTLVKERLGEIQQKKDLEYNLKTFLDASLKEGVFAYETTKLDLEASPAKVKKDSELIALSNAYLPESGCTHVELKYLWSGDLGTANPSQNESSFPTQYKYPGTKLLNLVIIGPGGTIDYNFYFVDVD